MLKTRIKHVLEKRGDGAEVSLYYPQYKCSFFWLNFSEREAYDFEYHDVVFEAQFKAEDYLSNQHAMERTRQKEKQRRKKKNKVLKRYTSIIKFP